MGNLATYACTALAGSNKAGILKPDADGYYTVVLGAMDVYNSAGSFYPWESAREVFKESSSLMRRIANGACRAEYGHPKRLPGMSIRDFIERILQIHEENVCAHIRKVWVTYDQIKDKNGRPVIAVLGEVKPCGPRGDTLKASLDNPSENVCFSVRSLTDDVRIGGVTHKNIRTIVTWDYVNEPGISVANKFMAPGLEGMDEVAITAASLGSIRDYQSTSGISMESSGGVTAAEAIEALGFEQPVVRTPASARW